MSRKRPSRRGAILAASLICLLIVLLYASAVARGLVLRQRATRWEERQMQCFWLAESAVARAIAQYSADPTYMGESWKVSLPSAGMREVGVAEIVVDSAAPPANGSGGSRVQITARWPDDPLDRIVQNREFILPVRERGKNP